MVRLLLEGSSNLMALGATKVEVSMKKISRRKTKSDIADVLNSIFCLFLLLIAMVSYFAGSLSTSMNSVLFASSRFTTLSIFATRML